MDAKRLATTNDKLNRVMRRKFGSYFMNTEVTCIQALALDYINANYEDHDISQKELERYLEIRGSSVSSLIDRLERDGYIRRESHGKDARFNRLVPTEKGRNIQVDISARINHYVNSLFDGIDDEELRVFEIVMLKMLKNAAL